MPNAKSLPAALRVVDISSDIAGAYCGWLFARLGATVTKAGRSRPAGQPGADAISLALDYFDTGKIQSGDPSLDDADIVICDDLERLRDFCGGTPDTLRQRHPGLVVGVASVFGLTGPLAGVPGTALDAQAVSSVAWVLGEKGRVPLSIPPGVLECQAGAHLAAACLMARFMGGDRVVDIALADVLANYVAVNCRLYIHHGLRWERAGRRASGSGGAYPFVILPCRDGDVCLSGRTRQEWERFVAAMGSPDWASQPRYQKLRAMGTQYPDEVDALVQPWLLERTKAEIEEITSRYQLTIAPLRTIADVLATPQLHDRGFLGDWRWRGRTLSAPGLPFKVATARSPDTGDGIRPAMLAHAGGPPPHPRGQDARPLAGLRVLDLGWVWSAPQVSSILAQFGAEVIKVEHSKRLDNTRLSGLVFKDGVKVEGPTTEMSPMFHQINQGKLGITLNMKQPAGIDLVRRLVARSDIVVENMSAGTMERTGLGYDVLRGLNERIIVVSMSGAGQFGPLSDMRTYAPTMSSFAGLETLIGYEGEGPVGALNFALGDPNAAAHALVAVSAALARREAEGAGCYIDLSQTEALLSTMTPYLLQAQVDGAQPGPLGNAHPAMAPHGIYPAAGPDQWLTIAVADDRQWAAFAQMAGPWARDPRFATTAARVAGHRALDEAVAAWTKLEERDALVARFRQAGIASSPVQSIEAFWRDPHFTARGLRHPAELPAMGSTDLFRAPWSISGTDAQSSRGPLLGEHNERVLKGILGLSDTEYARLEAEGVIL